jgi:hypothetical protein
VKIWKYTFLKKILKNIPLGQQGPAAFFTGAQGGSHSDFLFLYFQLSKYSEFKGKKILPRLQKSVKKLDRCIEEQFSLGAKVQSLQILN